MYGMVNNPEYFSEIVYLRAIAILAVISIHVSAFFTEMNSINFLTLLYMSIDTVSHFAVPLFVCISGFVLYNKYRESYSLKIFYKKRFLSVVPQYTFFTIFSFLYLYIGQIYFGREWTFEAIDIIYKYFTGTAFLYLSFFVLIIQLYFIYPVIETFFTKSVKVHKIFEFMILLLIVQILYQIFFIENLFLIGSVTMFLPYLFYFVLGMYVNSQYIQYKNMVKTLKNSFILYFALLLATVLGIGRWSITYFESNLNPQLIQIYNWVFDVISPFYYIVIFVFCLYLALIISNMNPNIGIKFLQKIGNYSFGIYLIHGFILFTLVIVIFPKFGFNANNWLFYPVVFALVLSLSLLFVYFMNKVPYHEYVIGNVR
jgi:probable poly-beta-1,6-N-acetyl-D-glucosamine export protein